MKGFGCNRGYDSKSDVGSKGLRVTSELTRGKVDDRYVLILHPVY